jgi:peptidoglycan/xylan/chitin deacetylase (PgdA/CDA1 family)
MIGLDRISTGRWYLKKTARFAAASLYYSLLKASSFFGVKEAASIRVLTYHNFEERPFDPYNINAEVFEAQMRWLAENKKTVSVKELEDHASGNKVLDRDAILVSIDDGFRNTYSVAYPILKKYGIPAVLFVSAGLIGKDEPCGRYINSYLTKEELNALAEGGITIGSHAFSHRSLGTMCYEEAAQEIRQSKEMLEGITGSPVTTFAYPYGTKADYNQQTKDILREQGFTSVFTSQHGPVTQGTDMLELPRVKTEAGEPMSMFRMQCDGGMDMWRVVDTLLYRLQQAR